MLIGQRVTLRGITRDDLERQWQFNNDVEVELAGGGDPPYPQSLERLQAEFNLNIVIELPLVVPNHRRVNTA